VPERKDNLTPEQRSYCMSRVKGKDTGIERSVRSALHRRGLRFRKHVKEHPGRPDVVFSKAKTVVFIDGDFWHGYRFESWKKDLSPFWVEKIQTNIARDERNHAALNDAGWTVIRVWQHEIETDLDDVVERITEVVGRRPQQGRPSKDGIGIMKAPTCLEASINTDITNTIEVIQEILENLPENTDAERNNALGVIDDSLKTLMLDDECEVSLADFDLQLAIFRDDIGEVDIRFRGSQDKIMRIREAMLELLS